MSAEQIPDDGRPLGTVHMPRPGEASEYDPPGGCEEPIGFADREREPWPRDKYCDQCYVLLEMGNDKDGWKPVGIVLFGIDGRRVAYDVNLIDCVQFQLDRIKRLRESGYELQMKGIDLDYAGIQCGRWAEAVTDLGCLKSAQEYPLQLKRDPKSVIRISKTKAPIDRAGLPQVWCDLLDSVYGASPDGLSVQSPADLGQ